MIFFARRGNVNDQHPYATAPNVNTQRHLHQSDFYISYTSPISILLRQTIRYPVAKKLESDYLEK
jgi:hypothetical protein